MKKLSGELKHESMNRGVTHTKYNEFQKRLEGLINEMSMENFSNTPDFILAEYLVECLKSYTHAHYRCNDWHSYDPEETCESPEPTK